MEKRILGWVLGAGASAFLVGCAAPLLMAPSLLMGAHTAALVTKERGVAVTLQVNPVIRRGYWQRCYRGPQTQRLIWSPELGVLLSVELLTYSPDRKLDPYSYVMRVTSIERGTP